MEKVKPITKLVGSHGVKTGEKNAQGKEIYEDKVSIFWKEIQKNDGGSFRVADIVIDRAWFKKFALECLEEEKELIEQGKIKENYKKWQIQCNWNGKWNLVEKEYETKKETVTNDDINFDDFKIKESAIMEVEPVVSADSLPF